MYLLSGLELELYSVHEYIYIYWWVADNLILHTENSQPLDMTHWQVSRRFPLQLDPHNIESGRMSCRPSQIVIEIAKVQTEKEADETLLSWDYVQPGAEEHVLRLLQCELINMKNPKSNQSNIYWSHSIRAGHGRFHQRQPHPATFERIW